MRRSDEQHVGSMRGKRAAANRTGDDASQIEHCHAGKRTLGGRKFLRRCVADLFDTEQRELCHGPALRVLIPFGERAARSNHKTCFGRCTLEYLGLPAIKRALHRSFVMRNTEQPKEPIAMMR